MSQVCCPKCKGLWEGDGVGSVCSTLRGVQQCDGILEAHVCLPEAPCYDPCCTTCYPPLKPPRDRLWEAIYAAEFVRRVADAARRDPMDDAMMVREAEEAEALANWHHEATKREKT